jgi:quercetin dioxygenase-like cupin family protein
MLDGTPEEVFKQIKRGEMPQGMHELSLPEEHFFGDGLYCKRIVLPAGSTAVQHKHKYSHLSALCSGIATVTVGHESTIYKAGAVILIEAGKMHSVKAITDCVWLCIHATEETNVDEIDKVLVE